MGWRRNLCGALQGSLDQRNYLLTCLWGPSKKKKPNQTNSPHSPTKRTNPKQNKKPPQQKTQPKQTTPKLIQCYMVYVCYTPIFVKGWKKKKRKPYMTKSQEFWCSWNLSSLIRDSTPYVMIMEKNHFCRKDILSINIVKTIIYMLACIYPFSLLFCALFHCPSGPKSSLSRSWGRVGGVVASHWYPKFLTRKCGMKLLFSYSRICLSLISHGF